MERNEAKDRYEAAVTDGETDSAGYYKNRIEEMSVNENGGKQHKREFRCQAIPPKAALEIGKVRYIGFNEYGYPDENYKLIDANEHIGRALRHIFLALDGEDRRNNLSHAATRLLFALEQEIIRGET